MPPRELSLTFEASAHKLTMAQLLDAIVDDTFIIAKHPLRPGSDDYNTYALERRIAPIGPAREHVIGVLAALQENLKSQRSNATIYEKNVDSHSSRGHGPRDAHRAHDPAVGSAGASRS